MGIGPWQLFIVLLIVLVIFGPKSLPRLARIIGSWVKEFKDIKSALPSSEDLDPTVSPPVAKTKSETTE
jgi:sec-independent protein translocase protein TatA